MKSASPNQTHEPEPSRDASVPPVEVSRADPLRASPRDTVPTHCYRCGALITRDGFVSRSKIDPMLCGECAYDIHGEDK